MVVLSIKRFSFFSFILLSLNGCTGAFFSKLSAVSAVLDTPKVVASPTNSPTLAPTPAIPPVYVPNGILNGHFDFDTSTGLMPFPIKRGSVTHHVHEYDKLNQTTTVDFFNPYNNFGAYGTQGSSPFDQIQTSVSTSDRFYIIIVNAPLNPGGVLQINGIPYSVRNYQNSVANLILSQVMPTAYTIGKPTKTGDVQLSSLAISFDSNIDAPSLLVPTSPTCVMPDDPGKYGEYRDGALVVQAISAQSLSLDPATGAELKSAGGPIWEGIIYNHYEAPATPQYTDICY
jgi:hypothetical protein